MGGEGGESLICPAGKKFPLEGEEGGRKRWHAVECPLLLFSTLLLTKLVSAPPLFMDLLLLPASAGGRGRAPFSTTTTFSYVRPPFVFETQHSSAKTDILFSSRDLAALRNWKCRLPSSSAVWRPRRFTLQGHPSDQNTIRPTCADCFLFLWPRMHVPNFLRMFRIGSLGEMGVKKENDTNVRTSSLYSQEQRASRRTARFTFGLPLLAWREEGGFSQHRGTLLPLLPSGREQIRVERGEERHCLLGFGPLLSFPAAVVQSLDVFILPPRLPLASQCNQGGRGQLSRFSSIHFQDCDAS